MIKSINDSKEYSLLTLENGLEVLLVSTEGCKMQSNRAAAAVAVQVGSFSDPLEAQGLAHFVEHMVFMGSTAYPVENYYDAFVHSHGGDCNAMTEGEFTVYQFSISSEHFPPALDIFAHALLYPLLNESAMERELEAIDSEFQSSLTDDGARLQQLLGVSSIDNHVLQKFSWGNEYSLKLFPSEKKVNVPALLKSFHRKHYLPSNMKLVMVSPDGLDEMETYVRSSAFNQMTSSTDASTGPTSDLPLPSLPSQDEVLRNMVLPLPAGSFCRLYRIIPCKKAHKILLSWQLPGIAVSYRSKSASYLAHLIGHEGPGSLLSELRRLGYATSLSAGVAEGNVDNNSIFAIFNITVGLTPSGLANWMSVTTVVFSYLTMLSDAGPQEWIFRELQEMADMQFAHHEEEEEEDVVEALAIELLPYRRVDRVDLLAAPYLFFEYKPEEIRSLLAHLKDPAIVRIELLSLAFYVPGRVEEEVEDPETEWEDHSGDDNEDDEEDDDEDEEDGEEHEEEQEEEEEDGEGDDDDESAEDEDTGAVAEVTLESILRDYTGPKKYLPLVVPPSNSEYRKNVWTKFLSCCYYQPA